MNLSVKLEEIQKNFGSFQAVQSVSFDVPKGQCVSLLGPNGAGKTTTLKMIMGLLKPSAGSLTILGETSLQISHKTKSKISLVPQDDNLDADLSIYENLVCFGNYYGMEKSDIESQISSSLSFVDLLDKKGAKVSELSGGMRRRISFARALLPNPELIILDEPTTGLDPQSRHMLWQKIRQLKAENKTILLTTHYMDEAERLSDLIVLVDKGQVITQGSPKELIKKHIESEVYEIEKPLPENLMGYRCEDIGESILLYSHKPIAKKDLPKEHHHRPANLEDVFLRLTGRSLREAN